MEASVMKELKWGKNEEKCWVQRCFDVAQRCENQCWKWQCCSVQRWKTQRCFNVILRCKFQRWHTQRCFNVGLTLRDVATSYQPKINIKPTLKCLLGRLFMTLLTNLGIAWNICSVRLFLWGKAGKEITESSRCIFLQTQHLRSVK